MVGTSTTVARGSDAAIASAQSSTPDADRAPTAIRTGTSMVNGGDNSSNTLGTPHASHSRPKVGSFAPAN